MTRQSFTELTQNLWVTQSEVYATNSGIFISEGEACLIDPGITHQEVSGIARFVEDMGAAPHALILSHGHWDHLLGAEYFPKIRVVAHVHYADRLREHRDEIQRQVIEWEARSGNRQTRVFVPPEPTDTFDKTISLPIGSQTLKLIHMPGHAADQIVIYHAPSATLWAGDMLSDLEIPFIIHNLSAYEETLAYLDTLKIQVLIPGHGNPTRNPEEIQARIAEDRAYLSKLHARIAQTLAEKGDIDEALARCEDISYRCPEDNAIPHRRNVESAYSELGGDAQDRHGWSQT